MRKMILLGADLSQVEAKVELMLAAASDEFYGTDVAKECVRLAQAHPEDFDIHRWSAAVVLDKSEADVKDTADEPERFAGKTTMHAFMRGIGAQTLSDSMLAKGYVVTPETCELRLARLRNRLPAIVDGFFPDVRRQIMRFRGLGTTFGGIWRCDYFRLEEPLYGKAYSYQPVRETVDLINQCGFIPLREAIKARRLKMPNNDPTRVPRLHIHGHDSLLVSVHPDDAWIVAEFLERLMGHVVRTYYAGDLQVPVTYSVGSTYKATHEFKRLPSKQQMREMAWHCAEAA